MWSLTCGHAIVEYGIPRRSFIFLGGKWYSTAANDIPRSEMKLHCRKRLDFLLAYPASTLIHKGMHKGVVAGCLPPFVEAAETE